MMARSYSWTVFKQNQMEMGKVTATRMMENTLTHDTMKNDLKMKLKLLDIDCDAKYLEDALPSI